MILNDQGALKKILNLAFENYVFWTDELHFLKIRIHPNQWF